VSKSQRVRRLLGETAREIGILVFVFAPLEAVFSDSPIDSRVIAGLIAGSLIAITSGILMEVDA
jgi:hypothetical protein